MRLSSLQKYILVQSYLSRRSLYPRDEFRSFYKDQKEAPKQEDQQNAMTKSIERLIDKGLLTGYGRRTPEKWYIDTIRLMPAGRRMAKSLLGQQQRLPLKLSPAKPKRP